MKVEYQVIFGDCSVFVLGVITFLYLVTIPDKSFNFYTQTTQNTIQDLKDLAIKYQQPFIQDIQIIPQDQECPQNYNQNIQLFNQTFGGTQKGCECLQNYNIDYSDKQCCLSGQSPDPYKCGDQLCPAQCDCNGSDIQALEKHEYQNWPFYNQNTQQYENYKGCLKVQSGYNIADNQPIKNGNNYECQDSNEKLCGNIICYPQDQNCPIHRIQITNDINQLQNVQTDLYEYQSTIENTDQKIYISRIDDQNYIPIISFKVIGEKENQKTHFLENLQRESYSNTSENSMTTNLQVEEKIFYQYSDPDYYQKLNSLPKFDEYDFSMQKMVTLYQEQIEKQYVNIKNECRELLPKYETLYEDWKNFLDEDLSDLEQYFLIACPAYFFLNLILITAQILSIQLIREQNFKPDQRDIISNAFFILFGISGLILYTAMGFQYINNVLDKVSVLVQFVQNSIDNDCPGKEGFQYIEPFIDIVEKEIDVNERAWFFVSVFIQPSVFYPFYLILFLVYHNKIKKNKDQNQNKNIQKYEIKENDPIQTSNQIQINTNINNTNNNHNQLQMQQEINTNQNNEINLK